MSAEGAEGYSKVAGMAHFRLLQVTQLEPAGFGDLLLYDPVTHRPCGTHPVTLDKRLVLRREQAGLRIPHYPRAGMSLRSSFIVHAAVLEEAGSIAVPHCTCEHSFSVGWTLAGTMHIPPQYIRWRLLVQCPLLLPPVPSADRNIEMANKETKLADGRP